LSFRERTAVETWNECACFNLNTWKSQPAFVRSLIKIGEISSVLLVNEQQQTGEWTNMKWYVSRPNVRPYSILIVRAICAGKESNSSTSKNLNILNACCKLFWVTLFVDI